MEDPDNTNNIAPVTGDNPETNAGNDGKESILVNTISKLSTVPVYVFVISIIGLLTLCMGLVLFSGPKGVNMNWLSSIAGWNIDVSLLSVIGLTILLIAIVTIVMLLYAKTLASIKEILGKLIWIFALMLFIGVLVWLAIYIKPKVLDKYKYLLLILVSLIGSNLFYRALQPSDEEKFRPNLQVEKIRFTLVYFAFVVVVCILFFTDIGGVRTKILGQSFIFTMVLLVLGLIYILNLLSFPIASKPTDKANSIIGGFTTFGIIHAILFVITVGCFFAGIYGNKEKFLDKSGNFSFKNQNFSFVSITFAIVVLLWISFFLVRSTKSPVDNLTGPEQKRLNNVANITQQAVNVVLGIALLGVIIGWSITLAENYKKGGSTATLIVNIFTILTVVYFAYKFFANTTQFQKSPYYKLVVNTIFYIPCLFYEIIAWLFSKLGIQLPSLDQLISGVKGTNIGNKNDLIMLAVIVFINIAYFFILPYSVNKIAKQGGNVLQLEPISLSQETPLGNYLKLNGFEEKLRPVAEVNQKHNYRYAISFWVFLDSNQGTNIDKYYTLMNYEEVPHVKWCPKNSELLITVRSPTNIVGNDIKFPEGRDTEGNTILYRQKQFKTQRWNNIILNFDGGTFDIFINGDLIKTKKQVAPEVTYGQLICGSPMLKGLICNIIYFDFTLTMTKVHYLYNLVKSRNPPIPVNSSLGSTEEVVRKALGDDGKTVIPIEIDFDIFDDIALDTPVKDVDKITTSLFKNYLSLGWYFKHNKDEGNAYTSGYEKSPDCDKSITKANNYSPQTSQADMDEQKEKMKKVMKVTK
jgi:hypothetical protein